MPVPMPKRDEEEKKPKVETPSEEYIPPLNETVYIQGPAIDALQLAMGNIEGVGKIVGLSLRKDLQDFIFEIWCIGASENDLLQWEITRLTRKDFGEKWKVDVSALQPTEPVQEILKKAQARKEKPPMLKFMDLKQIKKKKDS